MVPEPSSFAAVVVLGRSVLAVKGVVRNVDDNASIFGVGQLGERRWER